MVRKRGVARKSSSHRRVRRVKKYDHVVIPRRFKIQLPDLSDRIEKELKEFVELEPFVEAELTVKGVPTSQWQYYHGFAKRMLALYLNFTGETLQKEKQSLINEYVLRGYNLNVLQQEQDVVEVYVEVAFIFDTRVFAMEIHNMAFIENALVEVFKNGVLVASGYTDSQGKYSTIIAAGTYLIRISKTGWQTIEKTETVNHQTELMVNLPSGYPPLYISGIGAISTIGSVPNPEITESVSTEQNIGSGNPTISESVVVTTP